MRGRRERRVTGLILVCVLVLYGAVAWAVRGESQSRTEYAPLQLQAARLLEDCFRQVRGYKQELGIPMNELDYHQTGMLGEGYTGITTTRQGVFELPISTPERAFMECLHLAPQYYDITDLYYVMEMLSILPPKNVQRLLEECRSVKVKRLFLFMAEKAHHAWFGALNLDKIDLGSGKRVIAKRGVYDKKYQITIPAELKND